MGAERSGGEEEASGDVVGRRVAAGEGGGFGTWGMAEWGRGYGGVSSVFPPNPQSPGSGA